MAVSNSEPPIFVGSAEDSFLKDYSLVEFIGSGSYGGVYKAKNKLSNELTAVKIIYLQDHSSEGDFQETEIARAKLRREFLLPFGKNHKNIVNVYSALETKLDEKSLELLLKPVQNADDRKAKRVKANLEYFAAESGLALLINMEFCDMTLRQWIETGPSTVHNSTKRTQMNFILGLLEGLKFLHANKILHRDLKSENILLVNGCVKIGDFGIGRIIHSDQSTTSELTMKPSTTPLYKAPELDTQEYTLQADLFSLGLLIVEVLKMLNAKQRSIEFAMVRSGKFDLPTLPFKNAKKVVEKLTQRNVTMRFKTVEEIDFEVSATDKLSLEFPQKRFSYLFSSTRTQVLKGSPDSEDTDDDIMDTWMELSRGCELDDVLNCHNTRYRAIKDVCSYSADSKYLNFRIGDTIIAEQINGKWMTGRNLSTEKRGNVHLDHVQRLK